MDTTVSACNTFGNVSNAGSVAALAIQAAVGLAVGYRKGFSPHSTLQETWQKLGNIQTHLNAVTPERRRRIEAAAAIGLCRTLTDIGDHFQDLWDSHTELSQEYEQSPYIQRHFGQLRQLISNLEIEVRVLLNDTWTTTRFGARAVGPTLPPPPQNQSNSESTDITLADQGTTPPNPDANRESIEMAVV